MRHVLCVIVLVISCDLAVAADPGKQPAASGPGSPVLQRIFANWKARRERITSLHFVWDIRLTIPKGRPDGAEPDNGAVPTDRHKDEHGNELWIAGDDHVCAEFREWPSQPHAKSADKPGIVGRQTFNGQFESRFWVSPSEKMRFVPEGWMHPAKEQSDFGSRQFTPILLTYRTRHPWLPWRVEDCRLITENAIIDGVRYVKIEQTVKDNGVRTVDTCWVDPRRDDVVVAWERRPNGGPSHPTWRGSCEYQHDRHFGWVPIHWRASFGADTYLICESTVTAYDLNQPMPPQKCDPHFPPGTYVADAAHRQWYLVQPDGSKRMLTHDELGRLTTPVPI
ncbi:MAG TPA: hypothetical protein VHX68_15250, partial [Planctomycetaceae bacterium]|nr:hypothetical protein [Planctomycetaceae bacterium]